MDEILQQMLEVEKKADEMVRESEARAEQVVRDARREAAALEEQERKEITEEARKLLAARIADAEAERARRIEAAEKELDSRRARLVQKLPAAILGISRIIAGLEPLPEYHDTPVQTPAPTETGKGGGADQTG
ncbi:MAG: hypothetical protein GXP31_07430 [Kiritimatiellaeota bacterium]|nr:hypothetical protein [Kiritimatiellota bacterium]